MPARSYDEIYVLCGPDSAGFIRTGKQTVCLRKKRSGLAEQEAGSPLSTQDVINISRKADTRREGLAVGVCGWRPVERSYGINAGGARDTLGVTMYNKDSEEWRKCVNREMTTNHKKEDKEINEEITKAAKRAGML